jgi:TonB family protein
MARLSRRVVDWPVWIMRSPRFLSILTTTFLAFRSLTAASPDWAEAPQPAYPLHAALEGTMGEVKLRVIVNSDGRVRDAIIVRSSGKRELDYAARAAVLKWRLHKSRIQPRDIASGREVIVAFQESEKERHIAAAVLRRASEKGSAWKEGGYFSFPPEEVYPAAQRTARIRFTIGSDGHPRAVQLVQSSGSTALDTAYCRTQGNSNLDRVPGMGRRNCRGPRDIRRPALTDIA